MSWVLRSLSQAFILFLNLVFFTTSSLLAYAPESSFWEKRRRHTRPVQKQTLAHLPLPRPALSPSPSSPWLETLPSQLGRRKGPAEGLSTAPSVIHFQDIHLNTDAQKNLGRALETVIKKDQVDLVALEGVFAPMDLSAFRSKSDRDLTRKAAAFLFEQKKISGPVQTLLTTPYSLPVLVGVDDFSLYSAHVQSYQAAAPIQKTVKQEWKKAVARWTHEKNRVFNRSLRDFDHTVQAYRAKNLALGPYARFLASAVPSDPQPQVALFLAALEMEHQIPIESVRQDRARLIPRLLETLTPSQQDALNQAALAYKRGQTRLVSFYKRLQDFCEAAGVSLSRTPSLKAYIQYLLVSEAIDAEALLDQIRALEKKGYADRVQTQAEQHLVTQGRHLYLKGKLIDFSLSSDEWEEYKKEVTFIPHPTLSQREREFYWTFSQSLGPSPSGRGQGEGTPLKPFEHFYHYATARDLAMARRLVEAIQKHNAKRVVFIAGGFHNKGLTRYLKKQGIPTSHFIPRVTRLDDETGSSYLRLFTQEKTPLEKLFQGDRLFVSRVQWSYRLRSQIAFLNLGLGLWSDRLSDPAAYFTTKAPQSQVRVVDAHKNNPDRRVTVHTYQSGTYVFEMAPDNTVKEVHRQRPATRKAGHPRFHDRKGSIDLVSVVVGLLILAILAYAITNGGSVHQTSLLIQKQWATLRWVLVGVVLFLVSALYAFNPERRRLFRVLTDSWNPDPPAPPVTPAIPRIPPWVWEALRIQRETENESAFETFLTDPHRRETHIEWLVGYINSPRRAKRRASLLKDIEQFIEAHRHPPPPTLITSLSPEERFDAVHGPFVAHLLQDVNNRFNLNRRGFTGGALSLGSLLLSPLRLLVPSIGNSGVLIYEPQDDFGRLKKGRLAPHPSLANVALNQWIRQTEHPVSPDALKKIIIADIEVRTLRKKLDLATELGRRYPDLTPMQRMEILHRSHKKFMEDALDPNNLETLGADRVEATIEWYNTAPDLQVLNEIGTSREMEQQHGPPKEESAQPQEPTSAGSLTDQRLRLIQQIITTQLLDSSGEPVEEDHIDWAEARHWLTGELIQIKAARPRFHDRKGSIDLVSVVVGLLILAILAYAITSSGSVHQTSLLIQKQWATLRWVLVGVVLFLVSALYAFNPERRRLFRVLSDSWNPDPPAPTPVKPTIPRIPPWVWEALRIQTTTQDDSAIETFLTDPNRRQGHIERLVGYINNPRHTQRRAALLKDIEQFVQAYRHPPAPPS